MVQANNLAVLKGELEGPAGHLTAMEDVIRIAESRGVMTSQLRADRVASLVEAGRLDEALAEAPEAIASLEASGSYSVILAFAEAAVARALYERDSSDDPSVFADRALARFPAEVTAPSLTCQITANVGPVLLASGRRDETRALLETVQRVRLAAAEEGLLWLPSVVRCAASLDLGLAKRLCDGIVGRMPTHEVALETADAQILEAHHELRRAADGYAAVDFRWASLGADLDRAYAALGHGRCLAGLGDPDAESTLLEARQLFADMGALARVADCDALLADVTRLSS